MLLHLLRMALLMLLVLDHHLRLLLVCRVWLLLPGLADTKLLLLMLLLLSLQLLP